MYVTAVYLFFGLVLMLLLVANVYDVPELNLGRYFYLRSNDVGDEEAERQRLQSDGDRLPPPRYTETDTGVSSTAEQDAGSGGGGGFKRSKKAEDKKRLTDDSL